MEDSMAMENLNPNRLIRKADLRTTQLWFADGIVEIVLGTAWCFCAAVGGALRLLPQLTTTWIAALYGLAFLVCLLPLKRGILAAKSRVAFDRTGYANPQRVRGPLLFILLVNGLLSLSSFVGPHSVPVSEAYTMGVSIGLSGLYIAFGCACRQGRFFVVALIGMAAAVACWVRHLAPAFPLFLTSLGLSSIVAGSLTLARYVRRYPTSIGAA